MKEQFHFFWDGPLSQWSPSDFWIQNQRYNCAEQWMMAQKALLFGDKETHIKILSASSPRAQKALGRQVKGFDGERWLQNAKLIVYRGNIAKFEQNRQHRECLANTALSTIVEASPEDCIWGIGLDQEDPRALDRGQWRGLNWLGEILMLVRDDLFMDV